jgi:hypothetical protein
MCVLSYEPMKEKCLVVFTENRAKTSPAATRSKLLGVCE